MLIVMLPTYTSTACHVVVVWQPSNPTLIMSPSSSIPAATQLSQLSISSFPDNPQTPPPSTDP